MIGIYKIENKLNHKVYIGQSKNIEKRWKSHKSNAFYPNKEYGKALYRAFRKYGIENFLFEVIEECSLEQLAEREAYYIRYYQSNNNHYGYNETGGYDSPQYGTSGENHPNHKLMEKDVYYIRECYNQHRPKMEVYEEFKDRIGFTGFHKIWNNMTWPSVHQDVYTEENRQYYLFQRNSHPGSKNPRAKLSEEQVYDIRLRKKNGESMEEVYQDYAYTGMLKRSFANLWAGRSWKNIVV